MSEKKPWEELLERAKSRNDNKPFEKMMEEITDDMQHEMERKRAERGKNAVYGLILFIIIVILGAVLLGVAVRVFAAFAGL